MNFWNFTRFNKDKIWFGVSFYQAPGPIPPSWRRGFNKSKVLHEFHAGTSGSGWHWDDPAGTVALMAALPQLRSSDRQKLKKNVGKNGKIGMVCDMFYLPGKFGNKAQRISRVFSNVFCEIAVPMMLACLDDFKNWEYLRGQWGFTLGGERHHPVYRGESDWVHPLKFSRTGRARLCAKGSGSAYQKAKKSLVNNREGRRSPFQDREARPLAKGPLLF